MKDLTVILINIFLVLIYVNQSYAYIDPGTGSMLVQAVLAVIAAVSVSIGIFRHRIRSFLDRLFNRNRNE